MMSTPLEAWLEKAKKFDVYDKPAIAEYTLQEAITVIEKLKEALENYLKLKKEYGYGSSQSDIMRLAKAEANLEQALAIDPGKL